MSEFKGTKGKWYVERTSSENADYQARILSNIGKIWHAGEQKEQIMIIVGEPQKINGQANIHVEANALLISKAPEMLEMLQYFVDNNMLSVVGEEMAKQLIKQATEI